MVLWLTAMSAVRRSLGEVSVGDAPALLADEEETLSLESHMAASFETEAPSHPDADPLEAATLRMLVESLEGEKRSMLATQESMRASAEQREAELVEESKQLRDQVRALTNERDRLKLAHDEILVQRDELIEKLSQADRDLVELSALVETLRVSKTALEESHDFLARLRDHLDRLSGSLRMNEMWGAIRSFSFSLMDATTAKLNVSAVESSFNGALSYLEEVALPKALAISSMALRLGVQSWSVTLVFISDQWLALERVTSSIIRSAWQVIQPHYDKYLREHTTMFTGSMHRLYNEHFASHINVMVIPIIDIISRKYHYFMYHLAAAYYNEDLPRKLYFDSLSLLERLRINVDIVAMELTKTPIIHVVFGSSAFDFSRYFVYSLLMILILAFRSPIVWSIQMLLLVFFFPESCLPTASFYSQFRFPLSRKSLSSSLSPRPAER